MTSATAIGLGISIVGAFPLFVSGLLFLAHHPKVVTNIRSIDFDVGQMTGLGLAKVAIAILTLIPATSFVGVILATGWMGGAIAAHLRVHERFVIQTIVPILIWVGFGLRHVDQLRPLLGV